MASVTSSTGPKMDHFTKVPDVVKLIVAKMSPELLVQGQQVSKAIKSFSERNDVSVNVAKEMGIGKVKNAKELRTEVRHINAILQAYLPAAAKPAKVVDEFDRNSQLNSYIAAHQNEIQLHDSFNIMMEDFNQRGYFSMESRYDGPVYSPITRVNAIKTFIKNGILKNPKASWVKHLGQTIGKEEGTSLRHPEAFQIMLKEYLNTNPTTEEKNFAFSTSFFAAQCRADFLAMEALFLAGYEIKALDFTDFICHHVSHTNYYSLEVELAFRLMLKHGNHIGQETLLNQLDWIRDSDRYKAIIKGEPHLFKNNKDLPILTNNLNMWFDEFDTERTQRSLKVLAQFCSPEDRAILLGILEKWKEKSLKDIGATPSKDNEAKKKIVEDSFLSIKQMFQPK